MKTFLVSFFCCISFIQAQLSDSLTTAIQRKIDADSLMSVSIAIVQNGTVSYHHFGSIEKDKNQSPTPTTLFEIGSLSKVFTGMIFADAVLQNELKENDTLGAFIPNLKPRMAKITLMELASHHSGLPRLPNNLIKEGFDMQNPYRLYDEVALLDYLQNNEPNSIKKYEYSNLGMGILGYILAKKQDISYEERLKQFINNAQMNDTHVAIDSTKQGQWATGYDAKHKVAPFWDLNILAGAGGIRSNVTDLSKFCLSIFNPTHKLHAAFNKSLAQKVPSRGKLQVGMAWSWFEERGFALHNGGTGGFVSFMAIHPAKQTAVIILSNSAKGMDGTIDKLGLTIMKSF